VVELVATGSDISAMFHPALTWIDVSSVSGIGEGWTYDGVAFSKAAIPETAPHTQSIPDMQVQLALLSAQLESLNKAYDERVA
jgi:hypothetical protein